MCALFDAMSQSMLKLKLPRRIPGYEIRWNIKSQCWWELYNTQEVRKHPKDIIISTDILGIFYQVINKILKEDQMDPPCKGNQQARPGEGPLPPDVHRPQGIFNKAMVAQDEWRQVWYIMDTLQVKSLLQHVKNQCHLIIDSFLCCYFRTSKI